MLSEDFVDRNKHRRIFLMGATQKSPPGARRRRPEEEPKSLDAVFIPVRSETMKPKSLVDTGAGRVRAYVSRIDSPTCECGVGEKVGSVASGWSGESGVGQARKAARGVRSAPSGNQHLNLRSARSMVLGNGSNVIIVLLLAEKSCECDADRRPRQILLDGSSISPTIVQALKAGASEAIGTHSNELLASVARALERHEQSRQTDWREDDREAPFASLTPRQREIMDLVLAGQPNKIIAADLGISQRTVENHRASIMRKTGAKSLPALVRLAMVAEKTGHAASASQH